MKKWMKCVVIGVVIFLLICGWIYITIDPSRHFVQEKLPILAMPELQQPSNEDPLTHTPIGPNAQSDKVTTKVQLNSETKLKSTSFNIILLGIDSSEEASRSDSIILVHVSPSNKKMSIISLPRDTRIDLPGIGYTKVNHAHYLGELQGGNHAGTQAVIQATSNFFQVPIHYYVKTDFQGFINLIDEIGGVELDIPSDMNSREIKLKAGKQKLTGDEALKFVRERFTLPKGDFDRQANQVLLLKAVAAKLSSPHQMMKIPSLLKKLRRDIVDTNMKDSDVASFMWLFNEVHGKGMKYVQIPGESLRSEDPLVHKELWYWVPDMVRVESISQTYLQD
jgi:LCP family protein required for cell wall assembly